MELMLFYIAANSDSDGCVNTLHSAAIHRKLMQHFLLSGCNDTITVYSLKTLKGAFLHNNGSIGVAVRSPFVHLSNDDISLE